MTSAYDQGSRPRIELRHRLRIAREYAGLEQEQLAERMEVGRSTISNAELGKGTPRPTTVNAWALACGVQASWIKGDTPDGDPDGGGNHPFDHPEAGRGKKNGTLDYQFRTLVA